MITGAPVNVYDYGAVGDGVADDTVALQAAVTAATGKQLWLGTGNFKITATINLPQRIRMTGATNRATNTIITAAFAGPALKYTAGGGTSLEMYLEHFSVIGRADLYGAGNGIEITNGSSLNMHSCLVAGFGTNQVNIGTGSYGAIIRDVYVAETYGPGTSNANLYCESEFCHFDKIESDDAKYSIYLANGSYGTNIVNCTLEGFSTTCIHVENTSGAGRVIIQGNKIIDSRVGNGIYTNANNGQILNNSIKMSSTSTGIYLDVNSYSSVIVGNNIFGSDVGIYLENSGANIISNNIISGGVVALDVQGGSGSPTYSQVISDNTILCAPGGITLRHNQNSKTTYIGNTFRDSQTDAYVAPTIITGSPPILSSAANGTLNMISGQLVIPASGLVVAGGGGTNVVTAGAVDSAGAGFRMLQIPN